MEDLETIRDQLDSSDAAHRARAVEKLSLFPLPSVQALLIAALEDEDDRVRSAALTSCAGFPEFDDPSPLLPLLRDSDPAVRMSTATLLGTMGDSSATPHLFQLLDESSADETKLRATAIRALGRLCSLGDLPRLAVFLEDTDDRVRANTVEAIDTVFRSSFEALVAPLLDDTNNRVRGNALVAMWRYNPERCLRVLDDMSRSESKWFRLSAAWAAGETGSPRALRAVSHLVDDADPDIRILIIKTFAACHHIDPAGILDKAARDDDTTVASYARKALETLDENPD